MTREDFSALRAPLWLLAATVFAGAAAFHYTLQRVTAAEHRLQQENMRLREAQARLQLSGREREIIVQHRDAYRALERGGFVAPEQRINWVSGLRHASASAGSFGIEYQIGAQRAYRGAPQLNVPQLDVFESAMQLKTGFLHEEDLMRLIDALAEQKLGLFLLQECSMKRLTGVAALRFQPQIDAECHMVWLTAHPKEDGARR